MALAFVLVPVATYFLFNERFSMTYMIGIALIVGGIILTAQG
jgi:multidrug transporter EmrE-like cation transporter